MYRLTNGPRKTLPWENPLAAAQHKPFTGGLKFDNNPPSAHNPYQGIIFEDAFQDSDWLRMLKKFYCNKRSGSATEPMHWIRDCITGSRGSRVGFLLGESGVGKSWFVRYALTIALADEEVMRGVRSVIVDFRRLTTGHNDKSDALFKRFLAEVLRQVKYHGRSSGRGNSIGAMLERFVSAASGSRSHIVLVPDNIDLLERSLQIRLADDLLKMSHLVDNVQFIVPLRPEPRAFWDATSELRQYRFMVEKLAPVDFASMSELRFNSSHDLKPLSDYPVRDSSGKTFTFPQVGSWFIGGPGFKLVTGLSSPSARNCLGLIEPVLYSNRLCTLDNLARGPFCLEALMLEANGIYDPWNCPIINLFDNGNGSAAETGKNSLIRYRLLEWFVENETCSVTDSRFAEFCRDMGYSQQSIVGALDALLRGGLIEPVDAVSISGAELKWTHVTNVGRFYFSVLANDVWYLRLAVTRMHMDVRFLETSPIGIDRGLDEATVVQYIESEEQHEACNIMDTNGDGETVRRRLSSPSVLMREAIARYEPHEKSGAHKQEEKI